MNDWFNFTMNPIKKNINIDYYEKNKLSYNELYNICWNETIVKEIKLSINWFDYWLGNYKILNFINPMLSHTYNDVIEGLNIITFNAFSENVVNEYK